MSKQDIIIEIIKMLVNHVVSDAEQRDVPGLSSELRSKFRELTTIDEAKRQTMGDLRAHTRRCQACKTTYGSRSCLTCSEWHGMGKEIDEEMERNEKTSPHGVLDGLLDLKFSQRIVVEKQFEEWCRINGAKNSAQSFLVWLKHAFGSGIGKPGESQADTIERLLKEMVGKHKIRDCSKCALSGHGCGQTREECDTYHTKINSEIGTDALQDTITNELNSIHETAEKSISRIFKSARRAVDEARADTSASGKLSNYLLAVVRLHRAFFMMTRMCRSWVEVAKAEGSEDEELIGLATKSLDEIDDLIEKWENDIGGTALKD